MCRRDSPATTDSMQKKAVLTAHRRSWPSRDARDQARRHACNPIGQVRIRYQSQDRKGASSCNSTSLAGTCRRGDRVKRFFGRIISRKKNESGSSFFFACRFRPRFFMIAAFRQQSIAIPAMYQAPFARLSAHNCSASPRWRRHRTCGDEMMRAMLYEAAHSMLCIRRNGPGSRPGRCRS